MPLLVVQAFVNTWEGDSGTDLLADAATANPWLREAGLLHGDDLSDAELAEARDVREAIRALLVHNGGGAAPSPAESRVMAALAGHSRFGAGIVAGGDVELVPDHGGGSSALAGLLLVIRDAQRDGAWPRLKACRNPDCRWAYYDRSHAGRGAWCDMAVCGNRIKNRKLRSRRSAADGTTATRARA